ncbi:hypothetical protein [Streptosporangium sp. H16]|uniref:hypothetical protein n=1 Tax=Streptosporangium sp. H16 TaxID=3444184 RepID=UPI003F795765
MFGWLVNTLVVGVTAALTVTLSSAFVAFGFAYFRFPGRNLLFASVLGTMMLPAAATLVPTYLIWKSAGLAGAQVPLSAGGTSSGESPAPVSAGEEPETAGGSSPAGRVTPLRRAEAGPCRRSCRTIIVRQSMAGGGVFARRL